MHPSASSIANENGYALRNPLIKLISKEDLPSVAPYYSLGKDYCVTTDEGSPSFWQASFL